MAILRPRGEIVRRVLPSDRDLDPEDQSILVIKVPTTHVLQTFDRRSARAIRNESEEQENAAIRYLLGECLVDVENMYYGNEPFKLDKDDKGAVTEDCLDKLWDFLKEIASEIGRSGVVQREDRKNFSSPSQSA